ncbi:MAG: hypothetical protein QOF60_1481, partial [Actinomycetota bacterium]|nr:hypothetical protein [Actinomycetota bacterium]
MGGVAAVPLAAATSVHRQGAGPSRR